jgi:hypothetical protein
MTGQWFTPGTPVSSTNKTDCHDITEILLTGGVKHHNPISYAENSLHDFTIL